MVGAIDHLRVRLLEGLGLLRHHEAPHVPQVHLARPEQREPGGGLGGDLDHHAVQVGQPFHVVVRVSLEGDLHALLVGLEHERPGPDHRLRAIEVLELLLDFPREDRHVGRGGEVVQERRERLLQRDPQGVAVDDVDRLDDLEARAECGLGHEALDRVLRVLGGDLAPVDRRLVVELDALPERELDDRGALVLPLLGEIGDDREVGGGRLFCTVRVAHELAVDHVGPGVRQEADTLVRVQARRLPIRDPDDAAALGLLGEGGLRDDGQGDQRDEGEREGRASSHDRSSSSREVRVGNREERSGPERLPHYPRPTDLVNGTRRPHKALDMGDGAVL